jgi:Cof subfamily protein (haloacid dehalogenase superfamily)
MNEIFAICTDIDGTLLNDNKIINDYDKLMLSRAYYEKHISIVLASGRFKSGLTHIREELGFPCGYSCFNGSYVELDNKVIKDVKIDLSVLEKVIPIIKENNTYPIIYDLLDAYMETKGIWYNLQFKFSPLPSIITPLEDLLTKWKQTNYRPYKILAKDLYTEKLLKTQRQIIEANIEGVDTFLSSPNILEIVPTGISKGSTVEIVSNYLNTTNKHIMSFGDYHNDVDLIKYSGYGIAMKNAVDEVKEVAFAITDTNDNNGIGKAIEKYLFNKI